MQFKVLVPVTAILCIGILAVFLPLSAFAATPADLQTQSQKAPSQTEAPKSQPRGNVPGATTPPAQTASAAITIDSTVTHQTIAGFGTSERVVDDPHLTETFNPTTGRSAVALSRAQQDEILDKLYIDLGLTRVRAVNPDTAIGFGIEPVNDNSDPYVTDLTKFNFSWKLLDDHCDYIKRAQTRGVTTAFLSPAGRESWMGTQSAADVAEYAEWLLAQVNRCAALGARLPFLSIGNEPSYVRNPMSATFVRDVIKELGPRLRAAGYSTMFVVPDDIRSSNSAQVTSVILADPVARSYVGALATHLYDEPLSNIGQMKALSIQYGIPLWMTEFWVGALPTASLSGDALGWANLMQDLIGTYDVSAIDYMWGFFGQYDPAQLIIIRHQGIAYTGYEMRKEYYVTGQFSRFIKPGALRIGGTSYDDSLKVTAFKNGTELIIVIVNNDATSKSATIQLSGPMIPTAMQPTFTALKGLANWQNLPAIGVTDQSFNATLPGTSITTFISRQ